MASVWIHRAKACDILVRCTSRRDAYDFARSLLLNIPDSSVNSANEMIYGTMNNSNEPFYPLLGEFFVGASYNLQCIVVNDYFRPGYHWNQSGTVVVSKDEAIALGDMDEPDWFVPGETEKPVKKDTRTHRQLDDELDWYMNSDDYDCTADLKYGTCKCCGTLTYERTDI
jgi:hypothetical protein